MIEELDTGSGAFKLTNQTDSQILSELQRFGNFLQTLGINCPTEAPNSRENLANASEPFKAELLRSIQFQNKSIEGCLEEDAEMKTKQFELDVKALKGVLKQFGFQTDSNFFDTLEPGDVIEVYRADGFQIYRSLSFYDVTGYSLVDLATLEWYRLWERPSQVIEAMQEAAKEMISSVHRLTKSNVPKHLLKEIYYDGSGRRENQAASVVEFLHFASVFNSQKPDESVGFVCSARGQMLMKGDSAESLDFI